MNRSWAKLILPTLLLVGSGLYCWQARSGDAAAGAGATSASGSAAQSADYSGLLEGLAVGQSIGDWKIVRIAPEPASNQSPQLSIDFERKGSFVSVYLGRKEVAPGPPILTDKYGVSFGHMRPEGEPIPPTAAEELANKIAERVRRTESTVAVPAGL